jgi:hypothetical protein
VDVLFEGSSIRLQFMRGLLVQGILGIGLEEEVLEAIDNGVDGEHGFPVLAENV